MTLQARERERAAILFFVPQSKPDPASQVLRCT